jgi:hypothetical protein
MTLADGETTEEAVGSIRGGGFGRHFGDPRGTQEINLSQVQALSTVLLLPK